MLRIATFNLLHGISLRSGQCAEADLRAAAAALDVDVLGLQEVDRHQPRSCEVDQAAVMAEVLGARDWRFVPAVSGTPGTVRTWTPGVGDGSVLPDGPTYGVGLLARPPVRSWHVLRFPPSPVGAPLLVPAVPRPRIMHVPDEPRVAVAAVLETDSGPLTVATAHLSFVPGANARQLRRLSRWLQALPGPRVLAGDLNLPGPLPRLLTGWTPLARTGTYPVTRPRVQFDHVLGHGLDGWRAGPASALALPVSDHRALVVELRRA